MIRPFGWGDFVYLLFATEWTLLLSAFSFIGGGALGLLVALMRTSPARWLRTVASGYVQLFQGTPLLIQLFVVFFLPTYFNLEISALSAAAIGLSLNAGAFLGEVWQGAIQSVSRGQWDAAAALGLHRLRVLHLVVFPQAIRIATPPTVGFLVQLIKATSLTAIIGFTELTRAGQILVNSTFESFRIYMIVAIIYFVLCFPLTLLSRRLERHLARGL
ncbi:MAG: amino acid ABC transporter permease [Acetobacteraceae bacterium]